MSSPHYYTTVGGTVYDLRWVVSFRETPAQVLATFFGAPCSPLSFDPASFLVAWDASRAGNPAFLGSPAISVALPDLILGQTTLNVLFVTRYVDYPVLGYVDAWFASAAMAEDAQVPVNPPIRIPRASFLSVVPSGSQWYNPGGGNTYYNMDWVSLWNRSTPAMVRFADSSDIVIGFALTGFENAMQASKTRS